MNYLEEDLGVLAQTIDDLGFLGSAFLVTGATGLIGSLCLRAMQRNETVSAIGLARDPEKVRAMFGDAERLRFVYQDIAEPIPDSIACDYIIHAANPTASKYFLTNPVEAMDSIYSGTRQVLEYARKHRVKGVVYLSSMEAFGVVTGTDRAQEGDLGRIDLGNVRSCYSEGKRHAELLCKCYAEEYGVPVRVARLAQTFGAGVQKQENRVFAQFARSALRGENIVLHTTGQSCGNYCYTRDVICALLLLLQRGQNGETYNVVNEDTTMTIAEMAALVADRFSGGRSKVVFDIPEGNAFGYAPETKLRIGSEKLKALGWRPEFGLEEMYRRMVEEL